MPTRVELHQLARLRLRESEILFEARFYDGTAYLCGYAVELALKARICRLLGVDEYPDDRRYRPVYATHDLAQLLVLSGLSGKLRKERPSLLRNWHVTQFWGPELRYSPRGTFGRRGAEERLDAVRHPIDGVLAWIRRHW